MKDLSLDIIKDNIYFIKSPFDGEIIRFFVDKNDLVDKNQILAILKKNNSYIEIESDFSGIVLEICTGLDEHIDKWDDIFLIDIANDSSGDFSNIASSVDSPDYTLIYSFQQKILPNLIYSQTDMFLKGILHEKEKFIEFLLNEVYKNHNMTIPFTSDSFRVIEEIFNEKISVISIEWPELIGPFLTRRSYILINIESKKIQYFTCEKNQENKTFISSIIPLKGHMTRFNYGVSPQSSDAEKIRIINIFMGNV